MAITQSFFGSNRSIPERDDVAWGAQVTQMLVDIMLAAEESSWLLNSRGLPRRVAAESSLAASATLTQTHGVHRVQGTPGAVTLDATTAVADGTVAGVELVLIGAHATNTVTVPDAANTRLNGACTLALGEALTLWWDATDSVWQELSRSH